MKILYRTSSNYINKQFAGGMGTKTKAMYEAWNEDGYFLDVVGDVSLETLENAEVYDVILLELLGLRNDGKLEERLEIFKTCLLYTSPSPRDS